MPLRHSTAAALLALGTVPGCVAPSTLPPGVTPEDIRAEQRTQRVLVLEQTYDQQIRLDSLAYPLLGAAMAFCGEVAMPWPGFRTLHANAFPAEWRDAARATYGLGDTLQVFSVTPGGPADRAGLRRGDRLLRVGEHEPGLGQSGSLNLMRWLLDHLPDSDTLVVRYERAGSATTTSMALDMVCPYETVVFPSMAINAFADGGAVYVTTAMMRFAEDDELEAIVAHELAHNAMEHVQASMRNAALAGLFGLIGDVAVLLAGDTLPDESYTGYFMEKGARAFSKDFEREADYVGLYILARAGRNLDGAPDVFRAFALAEPESIDYAGTHPSPAERFLLMEAAIREIREKQAAGEPLEPEWKGGGEP
jgi:hypothetical protein